MSHNKRDSRFEDIGFGDGIEEDDQNAWAVSYGDVVTVLLTFLFLLLSISEINPKKFEEMQKQIKNEENEIQVDEIYKELKQVVETQGLSRLVDIQATRTGVEVSIGEKLLFGSGSSKIKQENINTLNSIVDIFKNLPKEYRFNIEGHTDDIPINNKDYRSNWHLSADRALSVLSLFLNNKFNEQRFSVQGMSDTKPLVKVFDDLGRVVPGSREKNRRVLIKVQ